MVDSNKYNEALRWREKYFSLSDELEKNEKIYADYLTVLQRALVRVSLAADGQDNELDRLLSSLRSLLRKEPVDQAAISGNLVQLEAVILRLDTQRKESGPQGTKSLLQLVEQLAQLSLSRDKQLALKRYSKSLGARAQQLSAYPELLDEYGRLQREALAEVAQASGKAREVTGSASHKGLLSRFFGSRSESVVAEYADSDLALEKATKPVEACSATVSALDSVQTTASETLLNDDEVSGSTSEAVKTSDDTLDGPSASHVPGEQASDLEPVIRVLAGLLEQLPLSVAERGQAEQLRDQLGERVAAGELDLVVDGAAELVLEALDKSQRDFEQFLLLLDDQLADINSFLGTLGQDGGARKDASQQLNAEVLGQVKGLSQAVSDAGDLGELKTSVQNQLSAIVSSMDGFVVAESYREQLLEEQLQAMSQQLAAVQSEARVIKKKLHNETLRALTDVLTGLPNREAFNERFLMERERFLRYKHAASIAILDIDYFKRVNDQHGHLVGDRVLQHVSAMLKKTIRSTDFLARYGGEEFILMMPETNLEDALITLEKIRKAVAEMPLDMLEAVTISSGVAAFQLGEKAEQLVERADQALYLAKEKGRNRVQLAESKQ